MSTDRHGDTHPTPPPDPDQASRPRQVRVELMDRTLTFPLVEGRHEVGSRPDLHLPHPSVSRRHAVLRLEDGELTVEDHGSTNGTRVEGRAVVGAERVPDGATLTFGSLEATVSEVSPDDLEPAVELRPTRDAAPDPVGGAAMDRTTAAMGSLKVFTLEKLPRLIERLEDRPSVARMAQTVGDALVTGLPCRRAEISELAGNGSWGILYSSPGGETPPGTGGAEPPDDSRGRSPADAGTDVEVVLRRGDLRMVLGFAHEAQARGFEPLARMMLSLLSLAGSSPARTRESPDPTPSPPEPATLTPALQQIYADAARVARGRVSVLITGESGTGKELLASYLHRASPRRDRAFVALNCAALPDDLLESELFGVEEGVATGVTARPGKFELAHDGTLFLDEIGDMAAATQAKILRVLQEGEVYRLGARQPRPASVRVVAATNRDLDALMREGAFRADLYHRIADWRVHLPPLRERRPDIPNLAVWFLEREAAALGIHISGISRRAMDALLAHEWPGNVRQLEREMARAALFVGEGRLLQSEHLQPALRADGAAGPDLSTLPARIEDLERREIRAALERHDGNLSAVARELGLARSTLYRRIEELGLGGTKP